MPLEWKKDYPLLSISLSKLTSRSAYRPLKRPLKTIEIPERLLITCLTINHRYEHDRISVAAAGALRNLALDERNCSMLGEYAMEELISKLPLPGEAPAIPGPATIYALCGTFLQLILHDSMNALRNLGSNDVMITLTLKCFRTAYFDP